MADAIEDSVRETQGISGLLELVKSANGRDSATAIYWQTEVQHTPLYPND